MKELLDAMVGMVAVVVVVVGVAELVGTIPVTTQGTMWIDDDAPSFVVPIQSCVVAFDELYCYYCCCCGGHCYCYCYCCGGEDSDDSDDE